VTARRKYHDVEVIPALEMAADPCGVIPLAIGEMLRELDGEARAEGHAVDWATFELGTARAHEIDGLAAGVGDYDPDALIIRVAALSFGDDDG
jgi:hypothetical protein